MMNVLKSIICKHRWFSPDLALFHNFRKHRFIIKCAECGKIRNTTGAQIQDNFELVRPPPVTFVTTRLNKGEDEITALEIPPGLDAADIAQEAAQ